MKITQGGKDMKAQRGPVVKVSDELKEMLNEALAIELSVTIQYMWQHVQLIGVKGEAVRDKFKKIGMVEMKHAEAVAERLWYVGGTPTVKPASINVGKSLKESLELNTKAEKEANHLYRKILEQAQKEGDVTTAFLTKKILEDVEEHHDTFMKMLKET
jgi:bacterioferritin